ncbi:MAG: hypothetical protein V4717_14675 [Bacteroidota bacterium]
MIEQIDTTKSHRDLAGMVYRLLGYMRNFLKLHFEAWPALLSCIKVDEGVLRKSVALTLVLFSKSKITTMKENNEISIPKQVSDLDTTSHSINRASVAPMIKRYDDFRQQLIEVKSSLPFEIPELPIGVMFKKNAITEVMADYSCCGIKIVPAINENGELTVVIFAVCYFGDNIYPLLRPVVVERLTALRTSMKLDEPQAGPPFPPSIDGFQKGYIACVPEEEFLSEVAKTL